MRTLARHQARRWCLAVLVCVFVWQGDARGEDVQHWQVAGRFLSLKVGQEDVAVFEVADAARVEIPLAALSEPNRRRIAELTGNDALSAEATSSAGDGATASDDPKAASMVSHAIDLLRLGNAHLAKQELLQASKVDPSSGEADFVTAMMYAVAARNYEKARDHFAEVISREPAHVAAIANLAVCELHTKQYSSAVAHFRRALELKPDGQAIADNMALAIQAAGVGRARMTEKVLADLNDLYRRALVDLKLSRLDPGANQALRFHGLDGRSIDPQSPTLLLDAVKSSAAAAPDSRGLQKPANRDGDSSGNGAQKP